MGLLSRASDKPAPQAGSKRTEYSPSTPLVLDEMGKTIRDKIKALPPKKSAPYTALSLLKAYGSFQAGICLALRKDVYSSYASVGLGIEKISLPQEKLWAPENASSKFMKLDFKEGLVNKHAEEGLVYWLFPLDRGEPWEAVMLLGVSGPSFSPESVWTVLQGVLEVMNPQVDKILRIDRKSSIALPNPTTLEGKIAQYHRIYTVFSCILLEVPESAGEKDKNAFHEAMLKAINLAGSVIALSAGNPLILLPQSMDRELILHRLTKSLNVKPILSFETDSSESALKQLQPFLHNGPGE
jgi:hypothetical protein